MRRREFLQGLAAGVVASSLPARAAEVRRIAVMMPVSEGDRFAAAFAAALRDALAQLGWREGQNIRTDYRFGLATLESARIAAKELLAQAPDLILPGSTLAIVAVREETASIPLVFVNVTDPVATGLVESLGHPGRNSTGFTNFEFAVAEKWLQTLAELVPSLTRTVVLGNPANPITAFYHRALDAAAAALKLPTRLLMVRDAQEIEAAIAALDHDPRGGLIVLPDALTIAHRARIIALAAEQHLPTAYPYRLFVEDGGLMSYSTYGVDLYRRAAAYVDLVLRGADPGTLPVQQPTRFELVLNASAARALGLTIPTALLARADEVIE